MSDSVANFIAVNCSKYETRSEANHIYQQSKLPRKTIFAKKLEIFWGKNGNIWQINLKYFANKMEIFCKKKVQMFLCVRNWMMDLHIWLNAGLWKLLLIITTKLLISTKLISGLTRVFKSIGFMQKQWVPTIWFLSLRRKHAKNILQSKNNFY